MLTLAAYRFDTPILYGDGLEKAWDSVNDIINDWLHNKGVNDVRSGSGTFSSNTKDADGKYSKEEIYSVAGKLVEVTLKEPTEHGHEFVTTVSVTNAGNCVSFYLTLAAETRDVSLAPVIIYPRCPKLIRSMLSLRNDWVFGGNEVLPPKPIVLAGKEGADKLANYIMYLDRTLPVTVVSELEGEPIWLDLPEKLAVDLAGLSAVVTIDSDASWSLNALLGKKQSCYLGAIRIYWPLNQRDNEPNDLVSNLWTAERLLSNDSDGKGLSRFTTFLRRRVMSTAALAVRAPATIRKIKAESSRQRLAKLQEKADANSEELEFARLFIDENEKLKNELEKTQAEAARQLARAETAEYALNRVKSGQSPDDSDEVDENVKEPVEGEVRFYKKTHSKPSYDVLVRISDCGHHTWQSAQKAEKAKNGVAKLENRNKWKTFHHCGSCNGGGVWKVVW
jgi:hypothetical protein